MKPKICPLHKDDRPYESYCLESACFWYLEWAKSCAIPVAVGVMADYRTRFGRNVQKEREGTVEAVFKSAPAADVVEVRYGRWEQVEILHVEDLNEEDKNCILIASMFCPECKRYHNEVYLYGSPTEMVRYCPNCGAKMDGGQDDV